jgi:hypothetical protein
MPKDIGDFPLGFVRLTFFLGVPQFGEIFDRDELFVT